MSEAPNLPDWSNVTPEKIKGWWNSAKEWLKWITSWRREEGQSDPSSKILIVGRGGVGKTTLASLLSGDPDFLSDPFGYYREDLSTTEHRLKDESERAIVVLPGQPHRQDVWDKHLQLVREGEYYGVILVMAYGYHALSEVIYNRLKAKYGTNRKPDFLVEYLRKKREEESEMIDAVLPYIANANREKMWVLTVVSKMDLWYPSQAEVRAYYGGEYQEKFQSSLSGPSKPQVRAELAEASLIIRNLMAGTAECLVRNAEGFDHPLQVASVMRLMDILNGLRHWEEES